MSLKITPNTHKYTDLLINHLTKLDFSLFEEGPVQFYFPQIFAENISILKEQLESFSFKTKISFAHKANKSNVFVKEAKNANISIDVASLNELKDAIKCGFVGENIECTGIKNEKFILESLKHNCLIIIDSISELELIKKLNNSKTTRIAFRINDPFCDSGNYRRISRFGILKKELIEIVNDIDQKIFSIEGLHIHFDDYIPENKAHIIDELLLLYKHLYNKKIFPKFINIGGSFRYNLVAENQKSSILNSIENTNFEEESYANTFLGLEVGRNKKISKTLVENKLFPDNTFEFLNKVFNHSNKNKEIIEDLNLSLNIEPGYSLLNSCGIIVMRVLGTKKIGENRNAVILDGNMYNISSNMRKWLTDPILISKGKNSNDFEGFVIGNLCKEDDILIDRKIKFEQAPKLGDLLVFCNTAGYYGSFEDTSAIKQPKNKNYVALLENKEIKIKPENEYLEEKNDNK